MALGGDVFLLDMGKPLKIYDLAIQMIKLSGLKVRDDNYNGDIEILELGINLEKNFMKSYLLTQRQKIHLIP